MTKQASDWRPVPVLIYRSDKTLRELLTEDRLRRRIQFFFIYIIFAMVSLLMTVVNLITGWRMLMMSTLIFGVANLLNIGLCMLSELTEQRTRYLCTVEIFILFNFFLVFGEPEGFSAIWVALLPSCGLLLYGLKNGTLISAGQFCILVFLFWTTPGNELLQIEYTDSFLLRFPLLYMAFFAVGFLFELLRSLMANELTEARNRYYFMHNHDALTGVYNRYGFNDRMDELLRKNGDAGCAFAIADLDYFKTVNDECGHAVGDEVLRRVAEDCVRLAGEHASVCRWGGEEFAILFHSDAEAEAICERILEERRTAIFRFDEHTFCKTISIGLVLIPSGHSMTAADIVNHADANLYLAKEQGRNRLICTTLA